MSHLTYRRGSTYRPYPPMPPLRSSSPALPLERLRLPKLVTKALALPRGSHHNAIAVTIAGISGANVGAKCAKDPGHLTLELADGAFSGMAIGANGGVSARRFLIEWKCAVTEVLIQHVIHGSAKRVSAVPDRTQNWWFCHWVQSELHRQHTTQYWGIAGTIIALSHSL